VPRLARPAIPAGVRMVETDPVLSRTVDAVWRTDRETPAVRAAVRAFRATADARGALRARERSRSAMTSGSAHGPEAARTNPDS
jgi:hypothetical protein